MSFLFRKVEDVTKISKSQSLTSVSIKDCTLRVPNKTTTLFLSSDNKSNLHFTRQMYFVHLYGLHVYCALVDLDSSGSPGVHPTPGLTSSTQVVCVCVRSYTSTHTPTTLTPAKIEKYTRQTPYLYPRQNIGSHTSNKR